MLLSGRIGVSAADVEREKLIEVTSAMSEEILSARDLSAMLDYAVSVISSYLNGDYDETDNISLSKPMKVYNTPMYYVFVLCDNEVIGKLEITKYNDSFFSTFDYGISDCIKKTYMDGENVNFVNYNGNIYMYSYNGKSYCVDESSTIKPEKAIKFNAPVQKISKSIEVNLEPYSMVKAEIQVNMDEIFADKTDKDDMESSTASILGEKNVDISGLTEAEKQKLFSKIAEMVADGGSYASANASYVGNVKYSVTGKWICWAACTAMAINCKKGKSLTAINVADAVNNSGYTPDGGIDCIKKSYSLYGYTVSDYISTAISGSEMMYYLSQNVPVQINIKSVNNIAHAVTVYYVELSQNSVKYKFIDPSRGSANAYKQITYTNLSPTQVTELFNYTGYTETGAQVTYTKWYRTYR